MDRPETNSSSKALLPQRLNQAAFAASLLGLCWLAMMAVHELGHVAAAWLTGGEVTKVVLHPLTISRTDLGLNPRPLAVVWAGPLWGVILPLALWVAARIATFAVVTPYLQFFAGFCLIANGVYIAAGSVEGVGDCRVMVQHGTSLWLMLLFGMITVPLGILLWHRLGSIKDFIQHPEHAPAAATWSMASTLLLVVMVELAFSPR